MKNKIVYAKPGRYFPIVMSGMRKRVLAEIDGRLFEESQKSTPRDAAGSAGTGAGAFGNGRLSRRLKGGRVPSANRTPAFLG